MGLFSPVGVACTVVFWFALLLHREKVQQGPLPAHVLLVCVFSGDFCFISQSKNMFNRLNGDSKLSMIVSM